MASTVAGCGGRSAASPLRGRLLSVADLPTGWSSTSANPRSVQLAGSSCFSSLPKRPEGFTYQDAAFVQGTSIPNLAEVLATGPGVQQTWQNLDRSLAACRSTTLDIAGARVQAAIHTLPLPALGPPSSAYAWDFTYSGIRFGVDLVLFRTGAYDGYLSYADLGPPPAATVTAFAEAAVTKAGDGSTAAVPDTLSITTAPVRSAPTALGTVAYREIGTGPPLIMITGYGATMSSWDRRFVDTLARHRRVVIFDNAGVGATRSPPGPLTIDAMADQTSAFISTLGLDQADVLGWSMGSMIAQALAVLHPGQVRRLILCAAYPGTGAAVPPSRATLNGFESGDQAEVMADLFPADQRAAQNSYLAAISSYPGAPPAPAATVSAQGRSIDRWWAGQDPAGRRSAAISVPTLIADGTVDRLDPLPNSQALAHLIPRSTLQLYPDAGHAFLFQEQAFASLVDSFLG
ncbi:MAG TPA: alpha/beta hydrolase [Acidimicrobiales bacterium]|nr:alpha/beta hydrolase [Acidimicrobiales bacterium]